MWTAIQGASRSVAAGILLTAAAIGLPAIALALVLIHRGRRLTSQAGAHREATGEGQP